MDKAKLKVKVRLNLHGLVTVESVQQVEEEEYEEVVKKAPKTVRPTLAVICMWIHRQRGPSIVIYISRYPAHIGS